MIPERAVGQVAYPAVVAMNVSSADLFRPSGTGLVLLYVLDNGDQSANSSPAAGFAAVAEVGVGLASGPCFYVH